VSPTPTETKVLSVLIGRPIEPRTAWADFLYHESLVYLGEAARAYDAGAFVAGAVMARAALESAFTTFTFTKRQANGTWRLDFPEKDRRGRLDFPKFDELAKGVEDATGFSVDERATVTRIKEDGDLSAHAAQRHRDQLKALDEAHGSGAPPPSSKAWPTPVEVEKNILDAAAILNKLLRALGI
jgi:hypothetical protein